MRRRVISFIVVAALAATLLVFGWVPEAEARCFTVGVNGIGQTICGLP